jgi:hypothetical protein
MLESKPITTATTGFSVDSLAPVFFPDCSSTASIRGYILILTLLIMGALTVSNLSTCLAWHLPSIEMDLCSSNLNSFLRNNHVQVYSLATQNTQDNGRVSALVLLY